jgi:16S rRNA (cytidine1402-2'-O)-methyltransferase
MTGTLSIVATPIGNLEDITLRALRILKESDLILAEDTRKTSILLNHYGIDRPTLSYHAHSNDSRMLKIVHMLMEGKNIALVTDAGTPGISDPGNELISYLLYRLPDLKIIPIPGASAVTTLLSVCGLNVSKFMFLGFLPKKKLQKELKLARESTQPIIFYESPHRIQKTLALIGEIFGNECQVVIGRELTKMYEEVLRGTLEEVQQLLKTTDGRGEYVCLVVPQALKHGHSSKENLQVINN